MFATATFHARNSANSTHSTGPKTETGKARSSKNAVKHGIFRAEPVLSGEDPAPWREFRRAILLDLDPRTLLELELAEQIVLEQWRVRRIHAAENDLYRQLIEGKKEEFEQEQSFERKKDRKSFEPPGAGSLTNELMSDKDCELERYQKYEQRCLGSIHRCIKQLREFQRNTVCEPGRFIQDLLEQEDAPDEANVQNEASEEKDEGGRMKDEAKNDPNHHSTLLIHHSAPSLEPSAEGIMQAKRDPDV